MQDGPTPSFLSDALVERLVQGDMEGQAEVQFADGLLQCGIIPVSFTFVYNMTVSTASCKRPNYSKKFRFLVVKFTYIIFILMNVA